MKTKRKTKIFNSVLFILEKNHKLNIKKFVWDSLGDTKKNYYKNKNKNLRQRWFKNTTKQRKNKLLKIKKWSRARLAFKHVALVRTTFLARTWTIQVDKAFVFASIRRRWTLLHARVAYQWTQTISAHLIVSIRNLKKKS